jgi:shikimate dehydrogenase
MTDRYAVFGNPLGHTKSPFIHTTFAAETGQDIAYTAVEAPLDGFRPAVEAFRPGGRGINITAPFKLEAYAMATRRSPRAEQAGAANALKFEGDEILAENFDGVGLVRDIEHNLGCTLGDRRVLLMGAGGAARGAVPAILDRHPAALVIVNRTVANAVALSERYAAFGNVTACGYGDIPAGPYDIVVNATSASLRGELPPIAAGLFDRTGTAYELAYGKGLTPFLRLAGEAAVDRLADGVGMLVEQAAEAFHWWRGVRPQTRPVITAITVPLR